MKFFGASDIGEPAMKLATVPRDTVLIGVVVKTAGSEKNKMAISSPAHNSRT